MRSRKGQREKTDDGENARLFVMGLGLGLGLGLRKADGVTLLLSSSPPLLVCTCIQSM